MAAYITGGAGSGGGGKLDFVEPYHHHTTTDDTDNYDYVDKWLNDCLKEEMPVVDEPLVEWDRQYCDRNALVSFCLSNRGYLIGICLTRNKKAILQHRL